MRDDDYNSLFGDRPSPHFWIFLVVTILALLLCLSIAAAEEGPADIEPHHILPPYIDEACAISHACQEIISWELIYMGEVVRAGDNLDMTLEECEELRSALESQTERFTEIYCRPRMGEREDS